MDVIDAPSLFNVSTELVGEYLLPHELEIVRSVETSKGYVKASTMVPGSPAV